VIEHPLHRTWTLWFDEPRLAKASRAADYESNLKSVGVFKTVESFWRCIDHVLLPSKMPVNSNYHCFVEGVKPMWEDPYNRQGGKWVITLKTKAPIFDVIWARILMGILGERISANGAVCGAVVLKSEICSFFIIVE